jgi:hypothetical protein
MVKMGGIFHLEFEVDQINNLGDESLPRLSSEFTLDWERVMRTDWQERFDAVEFDSPEYWELSDELDDAVATQRDKRLEITHGHVWERDERGHVDTANFFGEFHNGPKCENCGYIYCYHCYDEPQEPCDWEE